MSTGATDDPMGSAYQQLAHEDASSTGDWPADAKHDYEVALEDFHHAGTGDETNAQAQLGQAEARLRLGALAEEACEREDARSHCSAAADLLAELLPGDENAIRPRLALAHLQMARLDALLGRATAEPEFRAALRLAAATAQPQVLGAIWHYVGAYCQRRELGVAGLLARQVCLEAFEGVGDEESMLAELRQQVPLLQQLDETSAMLATARLLENSSALSDKFISILPTSEMLAILQLKPEVVGRLEELLRKPDLLSEIRAESIARARIAIPEFAKRFLEGELDLEQTRMATMHSANASPAGIAAPGSANSGDSPTARGMRLLATAIDDARAWTATAEDEFRQALSLLREGGNLAAVAYGWDRLGAYLLALAKPSPALLAYDLAREAAEQAGDSDSVNSALYGEAYALADLNEGTAQLGCLALLGPRGALKGLPTAAAALDQLHLTGHEHKSLERFINDKTACWHAIRDVVTKSEKPLPEFASRFLAGQLQFDDPQSMFDLVREPKRDVRYSDEAVTSLYHLYRRRWFRRSFVPAIPILIVISVLLLTGIILPARPLDILLGAAFLAYVAIWARSVNNSRRWVAAARTDMDMYKGLAEIERSSSTHDRAYGILQQFARNRAPFALFLRSFEQEAAQTVVDSARNPSRADVIDRAVIEGTSPSLAAAGLVEARQTMVSRVRGEQSRVESYLVTQVAGYLPVVAVWNPAAFGLNTREDLPRLEVSNDDWEMAVRLLISAAKFVVFECTVLAPGVLTELALIRNRQRVADTIIVIPSDSTADQIALLRDVAFLGLPKPDARPTPTTAEGPIEDFSRVIEEKTLIESDPATLDVFRGLLPLRGSADFRASPDRPDRADVVEPPPRG